MYNIPGIYLNKIAAYLHLSRPLNLATGLFSVFAGTAILGRLNETSTLIILSIVVVLYNAAANAVNDYFDYEIDLINRPVRPLSKGTLSLNEARGFSALLFITGTIFSFFLPVAATAIAVIVSMPLMVVYSWKLKKLPLIGNLVIAFILGLVFIFIGTGYENIGPMVIPALLAFGLTLVREIVKDMADIEGDRSGGARTLPESIGFKKTGLITLILSCFFGAALLIPYFTAYYGKLYLLIAGIGVSIPLWFGSIFLFFISKPDTANGFSKILKVSTILGVLAVYLG